MKEFIRKLIPSFENRFFDWVPLPSEGPQELDIALLRFTSQHPPSSIGIGESLSKDLQMIDANGDRAYLEASNEQNKALYERHGFEEIGRVQFENSPPAFPMIRELSN